VAIGTGVGGIAAGMPFEGCLTCNCEVRAGVGVVYSQPVT